MNYRKITCDGYNLHIINNKKFHTIDLKLFFTENVNKEKITYHNALVDIMTIKTKKYNTKVKLMKKCQDLYSLSPVSSTNRYGNLLTTVFGISIINSRYIDHNNLLENISLLKEIVLNPLVVNGAFLEKDMEIIKDLLRSDTKSVIEEPRLYSNVHLLELLDSNQNYNLTGFSDLELIDTMTGKSLYDYYQEMLKNSKIDFFISGNIYDEDKLIENIQTIFSFKNNQYHLVEPKIYHKQKNKEVKHFKETKNYQQSKLSIALKMYNLTDFESKYVLKILNELLGGDSDCLLMQNVREKNSLCYYIGSYINTLDNLMVINGGINKENYDKTISLIYESLDDIKKGHFTKKELEKAKAEYLTQLVYLFESNRKIIDYYYGREVFKTDDMDEKKRQIRRIKKEDIMKASEKILLDTIFFLEGDL